MIGALLVQHTVAMEVMSLKVEFLLEPPKLWQEDIDTEVRKPYRSSKRVNDRRSA